MQKAFIRLRRPAVPRWRALSLLVIRMLLLLLQLLPAAAPAAVYTAISFLPGASFFPSEAQWKAWGPSRSPSVPPSAFVSVRLSPLSKPLSSLSFFSAAAERGHTSGCLHTAGRRGRGTERRCKGAQSSSRRFGFSILLNPDGATTSQQLEQMHAAASRQFARLWAESGVQKEVRRRSRYTPRVTRGKGGRREVLRRRLQQRLLLRQQKEECSRINWSEPLQLKAHHLERLIAALKDNSDAEEDAIRRIEENILNTAVLQTPHAKEGPVPSGPQ